MTKTVTKTKTATKTAAASASDSGVKIRAKPRRMFDFKKLNKTTKRRPPGGLTRLQAKFYSRNNLSPASKYRWKRVMKKEMAKRDADMGNDRALLVSNDALELVIASYDAYIGQLLRAVAHTTAESGRATSKAADFNSALSTIGEFKGPVWNTAVAAG